MTVEKQIPDSSKDFGDSAPVLWLLASQVVFPAVRIGRAPNVPPTGDGRIDSDAFETSA